MADGFSLLDELRKLEEKNESGVLVLSRSEERMTVCYREGVIQNASSNLDTHRIGTYLLRHSLLTDKDVAKISSESQRSKTLIGETAVNRGLLDPRELADVVRHQAVDLLTYALENEFVQQSFTLAVRTLYASAGLSVAQILLEMSRQNPVDLDMDPASAFVLKDNGNLSGVPWLPSELCLLGELTVPSTIQDLAHRTDMDEPVLRRVLGVFRRLGIIEKVESPGSQPNTEVAARRPFPSEKLVPMVSNPVIGEELEILRNPSSLISEQFKTLKVRIREATQNPPRVLTISSPEQQDGKSLVSANFALALSLENNRRTVIVDCDLRSPTLDRYLGVAPEPGLIQYLSDGRFSPYCFMRRIGDLYFMTSGGVSERPTELLSLRKMKDLVEILKNDFDTIILDAPPFSPIADAQIISGLSDGLIMVVRRGKTSNRNIENSMKVLDKKKLLGVVFNDVEPMLFNSYYNQYDYSYHGQTSYSPPRRLRTGPKDYLKS